VGICGIQLTRNNKLGRDGYALPVSNDETSGRRELAKGIHRLFGAVLLHEANAARSQAAVYNPQSIIDGSFLTQCSTLQMELLTKRA